MPQILQVAALAIVTAGTGAATVSVLNQDIPDLAIPAGDWQPGSALDGMAFAVSGFDAKSGAEMTDQVLFRDGTFLSVDCENYCNFGWSDYETKVVDGVTHITTTALCPDAPHTVVWHATLDGDTIDIDVTWTTRRWYWTNQIVIQGTGVAVPGGVAAVLG